MDFNLLINTRDKFLKKLYFLKNKHSELQNEYLNKINENKDRIKSLTKKIDQKFLSISIEHSLIALPSRAIGSKAFSLLLNKKSSLYDNTQFNKIVRFLSFIETCENRYNTFYDSIKRSYILKPVESEMRDLITMNRVINYEYSLMKILCVQVDNDKVEFNKIYNAIEDRGLFLTASEKYQNEMLGKISGTLKEISDKIDMTNEALNQISFQLWEIDSSINSSKDEIIYSLNSLESAVQAGNALSAMQNYQL